MDTCQTYPLQNWTLRLAVLTNCLWKESLFWSVNVSSVKSCQMVLPLVALAGFDFLPRLDFRPVQDRFDFQWVKTYLLESE